MSVYKGENVIAGGSVDTYFVRKPAWSRAITITLAQLKAGYAAPEDGVFIGYVNPLTPTSTYIPVTINGLEVGLCATWQTARSYLNLTCQVNQGDVIQCANINTADSISLSFIPFEDSTIAEPEVVTPELIRNLHDPDWSQAETITAAQLNTGWTATKRGIVTGIGYGPTLNSCVAIRLNNSIVVGVFGGTDFNYGALHTPVNSGDTIKAETNISAASIKFVPYKAQ